MRPDKKKILSKSAVWQETSSAGTGGLQFFLSCSIAIAVISLSIYYRSDLIHTLRQVDIQWIVFGLVFYGVNYILRALRLRIVSGGRIRFWPNAVYSSSLHGFTTYLMPFRVGDLSLPFILKTNSGISISDGSSILIRVRLLDMITLGGFMLTAATIFDVSLALSLRIIWLAAGCILLVAPFVVRRLIASDWFQIRQFGKYLKFFAISGGFRFVEVIISLWIWMAVAGMFYCIVKAINLPIGLGDIWLIITIQLPLQMIPVQGIANTGNHEGGWIAALVLIGIPFSKAAEFAVISHIVILFYVLALGAVAFIMPIYTKTMTQKRSSRSL
jgi:uncharacterized membrane protein YbhN (UPF0104 family)